MAIPVSPRMTQPLIQPPLDVVSNMLPSLSMTDMCVVSLGMPALARSRGIGVSEEIVVRGLVGGPERPVLDLRVEGHRIAGDEQA